VLEEPMTLGSALNGQDGAGAARAQNSRGDAGHLRAPLADGDDRTREAVDVVLGAQDSLKREAR
jgi:hypothetical protein